ncbi:unnamed protein product [Tuber melanosporum]|uniref:(Perigord truffle) hypothetical protein n=1 Tax=Tuber melanosporum (strain Mel28) TaxID=656061 RepID=D5GCQ1_TUBMM|nr:uncharacterized protein GSTUM_00005963001 [Tuber melanosporum]CAZ82294.1 unnamed protein product [Tuber melanosporum]
MSASSVSSLELHRCSYHPHLILAVHPFRFYAENSAASSSSVASARCSLLAILRTTSSLIPLFSFLSPKIFLVYTPTRINGVSGGLGGVWILCLGLSDADNMLSNMYDMIPRGSAGGIKVSTLV